MKPQPRGFLWSILTVFTLALFFLPGCNSGSRDEGGLIGGPGGGTGGGGTGGSGGNTGGPLTASILFGLDEDDTVLCTGDVITLFGVNFSRNLGQNEVFFRSGRSVVRGAPITVAFPVDNNIRDGLDSRLSVLVPTGVLTGSIELVVNGSFAGGQGYIACPMLLGFTTGFAGQPPTEAAPTGREVIQNNGPFGYDPQLGPETLHLHGVNFDELTTIIVEDSQGQTDQIGTVDFQRRNLAPDNGMDTVIVSLAAANVKLGVRGFRDNLLVRVRTPNFVSNTIAVPQVNVELGGQIQGGVREAILGPVINGFVLPTGVRSGPFRIHYSFHDRPVTMSYEMVVEWTVDNGTNWSRAFTPPRGVDPLNSGDEGVVPGHFAFGSPAGLIRGGGTLKTFTWDPDNDSAFRALNDQVNDNGARPPRAWTVSFRIRAVPTQQGVAQRDPGILLFTPPIAFFDLQQRFEEDTIVEQRGAQFLETFSTDDRNVGDCSPADNPPEDECTDAIWGPDRLESRIEGRPIPQFGGGTLDLELMLTEPTATDEFFIIDTTRMQIEHVIEEGEVIDTDPIFPDRALAIENPGEDDGEFHLRTLTVGPGVRVECIGTRPLRIRLSGPGDDLDVAFRLEGDILANGLPGEVLADSCLAVGGGGVLGGGDGGNGAIPDIPAAKGDPPRFSYNITRATSGGNGGGTFGESSMGLGPSLMGANARVDFAGGPGGGGGGLHRGGNGDARSPRPSLFTEARSGVGGPARGDRELSVPAPGAGGGGGGIGVTRSSMPMAFFDDAEVHPGGAGGGGGGGIDVRCRGSMMIVGTVQCEGGNGSNPVDKAGGPGGGGSGGSIGLRATGLVDVGCDNLQVEGGAPGSATGTNGGPGDGVGSPGRIFVGSQFGGLPYCGTLATDTRLTARLSASIDRNTVIEVESTQGFPDRGVLLVERELIEYEDTTPSKFQRLSRGVQRTAISSHEAGSVVAFQDAVVVPSEALGESEDIRLAPGSIDAGSGLDGVLHCFFVASIDPETGDALTDEAGNPMSIWTYDTVTGIVRDPRGAIEMNAAASITRPGVLQLTRLIIDEGVTLACFGLYPAQFLVTESVDIGGHLDGDGSDGGILIFNSDSRESPNPGVGARGGPGGGNGGAGGTIVFADGDPTNRALENVDVIHGAPGGLPFVLGSAIDPDPNDPVLGGGGGIGIRDGSCEPNSCVEFAGGGGGGSNRTDGGDGVPGGTGGEGAPAIGEETLRRNGQLLLSGGSGAGGGGPSINRSPDYVSGRAGDAIFQGSAAYGPGTGGGGGGGGVRLSVRGACLIRSTGRISANGGDAFQSIDLAGNGAPGGGGTILLQAANALTMEPGAKLEVLGGRANLPVPIAVRQTLPPYEGNVRSVAFGGLGGTAASGRVRIEAPAGSALLGSGQNVSLVSGSIAIDTQTSFALSRAFRLGVGPGSGVLSAGLAFSAPTVLSGRQPVGTERIVLWESASESLEVFGEVGEFFGGVTDPGDLENHDFVRFRVIMQGNQRTFETAVIQSITLGYNKTDLPRIIGN